VNLTWLLEQITVTKADGVTFFQLKAADKALSKNNLAVGMLGTP
jgi:hypothetical protein